MISIDVLAIGHVERKEDGGVDPENTWSTSTLIRTEDGHNIVVDTSRPFMKPAIRTSFKQIGKLFPEDVDYVVLTHSHGDHTGCNDMFPNAKIIMHAGEKCKVPGAEKIDKDLEIAKGVRLVHTPGHSKGSMSVFIEADRKYVIAGDACPTQDNYLRMMPPALNEDMEAALASLKKIAEFADVIVPGHGAPFMTKVR